MNIPTTSNAKKSLFLSTIGFIVTFASWGIISGLSPLLKQSLALSATQTSIMLAIPVLLAAVGRIPMGILTDRFGGRLVFSLLLILGIVPSLALSINHAYTSLLFWGLWLGMAGTSFAVGITFISQWFPPEKQGTVLGLFGIGNVGQSLAVLLGPMLAGTIGISKTFLVFGWALLHEYFLGPNLLDF
ncbi:MAG: MFS transporter [Cyanobacteria bacterium P01_F01_bin.53]